jgi:hypothetical protein
MGRTNGTIKFIGKNLICFGWCSGDQWNLNIATATGTNTMIDGTRPMLAANYRPISGSPVITQAAVSTSSLS